MAQVKSVLTLNQGEVNELNLVAQQAQRLQLAPHDYDHAMILLTPNPLQQQHDFDRQPLLLAAATIDQLYDEQNEQVTRHIDHELHRQHTQLIIPRPEHMGKVEEDIAIFENISTMRLSPPSRLQLYEVPHDSGVVSLNDSQAGDQPMIFNSSHTHRLETFDEQYLESLSDNDYYRRRIRALDLLRPVHTDPNAHIQPVRHMPMNILESTVRLSVHDLPTDHTRVIDERQSNRYETLEHTDEPVIYETYDQEFIRRMPARERLPPGELIRDDRSMHQADENQLRWGQGPPHRSNQHHLPERDVEQTAPLHTNQFERTVQVRSTEEASQPLETPKQPHKKTVYGYGKSTEQRDIRLPSGTSNEPIDMPAYPLHLGERNEIHISRTSSFSSDVHQQMESRDSARVQHDHHTLSSLDNISQPIYQHPPVHTHQDQQHTTKVTELFIERSGSILHLPRRKNMNRTSMTNPWLYEKRPRWKTTCPTAVRSDAFPSLDPFRHSALHNR